MKSNQFKLLKIAGLLLAAGVFSNQALAASADGSATATVIAPITITGGNSIAFGEITTGVAGTKTVAASSGASFTVGGETGKVYVITLPDDLGYINKVGAETPTSKQKINIKTFTKTDPATGTDYITGTDNFKVGATLDYPADIEAGSYSGTFSVSVVYQ